jgi:hypothetical protein
VSSVTKGALMTAARDGGSPQRGVEGDGWREIWATLRLTVPVVLAAYAIAGLFGVIYGLLTVLSTLSVGARATIAATAVAPLVLAPLWPRLTGVKLFGVEATMARFEVRIDVELAAAISSDQYFSGRQDILLQIERAISGPRIEVIEVNLHDGDYWWQTRLFLLAALADDFANVRQLVFVQEGVKRFFVGLAPASSVRKAIAAEYPVLDFAYRKIKEGQEGVGPNVSAIVHSWVAHPFDPHPLAEPRPGLEERKGETELVVKVDDGSLRGWLAKVGQEMGLRQSMEWSGFSTREILHGVVRGAEGPYVALLRGQVLDRVVNRQAVANELALRSLA